MSNKNLKIISLGMGVQSFTLYLLSSLEIIARADHAIFADPGREHPETYDLVAWLQSRWKSKGWIPFHYEASTLYTDILSQENSTGNKFASIPAFTDSDQGGGMLRRQCTREYKIDVVMQKIRELYKLEKRQWLPITELWLGISRDEIQRAKENPSNRLTNKYPLLDLSWSRSDCKNWLQKQGFPLPQKSACVFCPYQSDSQWKKLKENHPNEFQKAVEVDHLIRDMTQKGVKEPAYLHRSLQPLEEVEFDSQQELFENECEGFCGL